MRQSIQMRRSIKTLVVPRRIRRAILTALVGSWLASATLWAQSQERFHPDDTRVFKAVACTRDRVPVEALYYVIASRTDMAAGLASPSSQLMFDEVASSWRLVASQLTEAEVMDERYADRYDTVMSQAVARLQEAVEEKTGVSVTVSEVNSRPMDRDKDQAVPSCPP